MPLYRLCHRSRHAPPARALSRTSLCTLLPRRATCASFAPSFTICIPSARPAILILLRSPMFPRTPQPVPVPPNPRSPPNPCPRPPPAFCTPPTLALARPLRSAPRSRSPPNPCPRSHPMCPCPPTHAPARPLCPAPCPRLPTRARPCLPICAHARPCTPPTLARAPSNLCSRSPLHPAHAPRALRPSLQSMKKEF